MTNLKRTAVSPIDHKHPLVIDFTDARSDLAIRTSSTSSATSQPTGRASLLRQLQTTNTKRGPLLGSQIHIAAHRGELYRDLFNMKFHPKVIAKMDIASLRAIAVKTSEFCNRLKALVHPSEPFGCTDEQVRDHLGLCPGIIIPEGVDDETYDLLIADIKTEVDAQNCPKLYRIKYNDTTYLCDKTQKKAIFDDYESQKKAMARRLQIGVGVLSVIGGGVFVSGISVVAASPLSSVGILASLESNITHFLFLSLMLKDLGARVAPRVERLFSISRPEVTHAPFSGRMSLEGSIDRVTYQITEVDLERSSLEEQEALATQIQDGFTSFGEGSAPLYIFHPSAGYPTKGPLFESNRLLWCGTKKQTPTEAYMSLEDILEETSPQTNWTQEAITALFVIVYENRTQTLNMEILAEVLDVIPTELHLVTYEELKEKETTSFKCPDKANFQDFTLDPIEQHTSAFKPLKTELLTELTAAMKTRHYLEPSELAPDLIGARPEKRRAHQFALPDGDQTKRKSSQILGISGPFGTGKTHLSFEIVAKLNSYEKSPLTTKKPFNIRENGQDYISFLGRDEYLAKFKEISKSNPILSSKAIIIGIAAFGMTMTTLYLAQLNEAAKNCTSDEERSLVAATTSFVNSLAELVKSTPGISAEDIGTQFSKALEILRAPTDQDIAPGSQAFPIILPGIPCANVGTIRQTIQTMSMALFGLLSTFWASVKVSSMLTFQRDNHITLVPPLETTFSLPENLPSTDEELETLLLRIYASNHGCLYIQNGQHLTKPRLEQLLRLHHTHIENEDTKTNLLVIVTTNPGQGDPSQERSLNLYLNSLKGTKTTDYLHVILPKFITDTGADTTRELSFLIEQFCKHNSRPPLNEKSKALIISFVRQVAVLEDRPTQLDVGRKFQQLLHTVHWKLDSGGHFQLTTDDLALAYEAIRFESRNSQI